MEVRVLRSPEELFKQAANWIDLANDAEEANVFYESWMLLPALKYLLDGSQVEVVLIFEKCEPAGTERLCALFPLERARKFKRLPLNHYRLWKHKHCFLNTPLIRKGRVTESLDVFFEWLESQPGLSNLFGWNWVNAEGMIGGVLSEMARKRGWRTDEIFFQRALLPKMPDPEEYLQATISKKQLNEYARIERRMSESGKISYERMKSSDSVDSWIQDFMALEASGWKGSEGTALSCNEAEKSFFTSITHAAHEAKKLFMYRLRINDETVAAVCEFMGNGVGFSFKSAYHEKYAKFRPSMRLQLWHIRNIADLPVSSVDSCADPDHPLLDSIWTKRRHILELTMARRLFPEGLLMTAAAKARKLRARAGS